MPVWNSKAPHGVDMACKGDFELASDQVPELYRPIVATRDKEPIKGVDCQAPNPAIVSCNDRL